MADQQTIERPAAGAGTSGTQGSGTQGNSTTSAISGTIFDDDGDDDGGASAASSGSQQQNGQQNGQGKDGDASGTDGGGNGGMWREDWREALAGEDTKFLAELKRHATFDSYAKSMKALRQKMSSGEYKRDVPFPAEGTPEQQAQWREERGLPKEPSGYEVPKIQNVEWGDADKPLLDAFFAKMHGKNASQEQVNAALETYAELVGKANLERDEADKVYKLEAEDALRSEFGKDYRGNVNLMKRLLTDAEAMPDGIGEMIAGSRTADGQRLINNPAVAKYFIELARNRYGDAGMVTGSEMKAFNDRETEINRIMKTDIKRYYAEGLDKELAEITARKSGNKNAADYYYS